MITTTAVQRRVSPGVWSKGEKEKKSKREKVCTEKTKSGCQDMPVPIPCHDVKLNDFFRKPKVFHLWKLWWLPFSGLDLGGGVAGTCDRAWGDSGTGAL